MADISEHVDSVAALIYEQYEKRNATEKARTYLGASIIGNECSRSLWYDFRWATKKKHDGQLLRLFQSGHLAEPRFVADLRSIGVEVYDVDPATGKQFGFVDHAGHMRGHMDGCARNIPDGGRKWHVLEFKTHSNKSFTELRKKGVQVAKPAHYAQMQWYMGKSGMDRALYLAVNKDNDELYSERIEFDKTYFEQIQSKAERIIFATEPPPKLSDDPKHFVCNWCDHKEVCHAGKGVALSCRTCVHATPERQGDGIWSCAAAGRKPIPVEIQRVGCPQHMVLPFLLTYAEPIDAGETWVRYKRKDNGQEFLVGRGVDADVPAYTSAEICAANDHRIIGDPEVEKFRTEFGASIVG
jgi:hypothetical protein